MDPKRLQEGWETTPPTFFGRGGSGRATAATAVRSYTEAHESGAVNREHLDRPRADFAPLRRVRGDWYVDHHEPPPSGARGGLRPRDPEAKRSTDRLRLACASRQACGLQGPPPPVPTDDSAARVRLVTDRP